MKSRGSGGLRKLAGRGMICLMLLNQVIPKKVYWQFRMVADLIQALIYMKVTSTVIFQSLNMMMLFGLQIKQVLMLMEALWEALMHLFCPKVNLWKSLLNMEGIYVLLKQN